MKLFKNIELSHDTLDNKTYQEKFKALRKYLQSKYHFDYMISLIIASGIVKKIDGNTTLDDSVVALNIGDIPQSVFNKNVLTDSKKKGIKARFKIPFYVNDTKHLIIIEARRENTIIGNEDLIYKDIITFKNIISNSPLC